MWRSFATGNLLVIIVLCDEGQAPAAEPRHGGSANKALVGLHPKLAAGAS